MFRLRDYSSCLFIPLFLKQNENGLDSSTPGFAYLGFLKVKSKDVHPIMKVHNLQTYVLFMQDIPFNY